MILGSRKRWTREYKQFYQWRLLITQWSEVATGSHKPLGSASGTTSPWGQPVGPVGSWSHSSHSTLMITLSHLANTDVRVKVESGTQLCCPLVLWCCMLHTLYHSTDKGRNYVNPFLTEQELSTLNYDSLLYSFQFNIAQTNIHTYVNKVRGK